MKAQSRMIWDCGICDISWDTEDEAEWCCSQECDHDTARFNALKEKAEEDAAKTPIEVLPGGAQTV